MLWADPLIDEDTSHSDPVTHCLQNTKAAESGKDYATDKSKEECVPSFLYWIPIYHYDSEQ